MITRLNRSKSSTVSATAKHRTAFLNPDSLPWTDWVMPGTWFKLLNVNVVNNGFTMLLKVDGNNLAPLLGHLGAVEGTLPGGGFGNGADRGRVGDYV